MKINFKKIASVLATTVMLGSTVAFAAAAYPAPLVNNGSADSAIVVGSAAAASDMAAATDLQTSLNAGVTTTGTTTLTGTGDKASVGSTTRNIYYGDQMNSSKSSLTATELPTVLAGGTVMDLSGTEYAYTQNIALGPRTVKFGTSDGDLADPTLYLDAGTDVANPLYTYSLSFNKNINVSDSTNVQGQKITLLGVDYVIGASSTKTALYLYGSGESMTMTGGDTKTVNIAGTDHSVNFVGATGTTTAKITVDGVSKTVTKGSSYSFAGDLNVYVKDVTYQQYAGGLQSIDLIIGANTLLIQNAQSVKKGADQTSVQNTLGTITADGNGLVSGISVAVAVNKSQYDNINAGSSFTDPVFGGLKVSLVGINPTLDDTSRAKVKVSTDNNQYAYVTFTSARAGDKGEQQLTYAYDNDTSASSVTPQLAHMTINSQGKGKIHVLEGESALVNDWIIVNQGDAGTILNVDDISIDTGTSGTVTLSDAITGDSQKVTLTNSTGMYAKSGVNFFGGNGYTITVNPNVNPNTVNITWSGTSQTLFPRIKLQSGGWLSILSATTVPIGSSVIFPTGETTVGTTTATLLNSSLTNLVQGINWTTNNVTNNGITVNGIANANGVCNFSSARGPAILVMEPKKWNDGSYGDFICIPMTTTGTNPELAISTPLFNGSNSGFVTYQSDTYKTAAVDKYGTFVTMESRTNENGVATLEIPSSQMYFDIQFTSQAVSATSTAKIQIVKDTEVSSVSDKNLVVVGGSCINTVAATLLGKTSPVCGADFSALTGVGAGQYLIETVASPLNAQKIAMLVAGYDAADTSAAVAKVKEGKESTTVGAKTVYPLASA